MAMTGPVLRLPDPCVVVLVGPSGAGKSTWAAANFAPGAIVSSDQLRALVGLGEHDLRASADAFDVLDLVVARRVKRRLTTVIDTLGFDDARRAAWLALARRHRLPCIAIGFDVPAREARRRLDARARKVPPPVLRGQFERWRALRVALGDDGFDAVHFDPGPVALVAPHLVDAPVLLQRQKETPMTMRFGLQIPSFTWPGGPAEIGERLGAIVRAADDVGFDSVWVMDHFFQIPVVGPDWHDMLDSYTTLGYIAAHTRRVRIGTMVTGITYRNVAHLGKIVATLDVLSGGRAICGIGAAWFQQEHEAYGWEFPPRRERFELLEDALQLLPLLWGPGSPSFEGKRIRVPKAMCYPRPVQERIPILVGGSGEKVTLKLVAKYADACNLFGEADTVRHKIAVLHDHCARIDRDPTQIEITQLSSVTPDVSLADQIGRYRGLAEAGVQTAIVNMPDVADPAAIDRFAAVIDAFR